MSCPEESDSTTLCGCDNSCSAMITIPDAVNCTDWSFVYFENATNTDYDNLYDWMGKFLSPPQRSPITLTSNVAVNCSLSDVTIHTADGNTVVPLAQSTSASCSATLSATPHPLKTYLSLKQLLSPNASALITIHRPFVDLIQVNENGLFTVNATTCCVPLNATHLELTCGEENATSVDFDGLDGTFPFGSDSDYSSCTLVANGTCGDTVVIFMKPTAPDVGEGRRLEEKSDNPDWTLLIIFGSHLLFWFLTHAKRRWVKPRLL